MATKEVLFEISTSAGRASYIVSQYSELKMTIEPFLNVRIINLNPANQEKINCGLDNWKIAYAWVMQFQTKSARECDFPFNTPAFQAGRPVGEFLNATLELCFACLNFADRTGMSETLKYRNAWEWWKGILLEFETGHLASSVGVDASDLAPFRPLGSKREIDKIMKREIAKLKKSENPYSGKMPNFHKLIDFSTSVNKIDFPGGSFHEREQYRFRNGAWHNFVCSYISFRSRIHNDPNIMVSKIEEGQVKKKHGGKTVSPKKTQGVSLPQSRKKRKTLIKEGQVKKKHGGKTVSPKKTQGVSLPQSRGKRKNVKEA